MLDALQVCCLDGVSHLGQWSNQSPNGAFLFVPFLCIPKLVGAFKRRLCLPEEVFQFPWILGHPEVDGSCLGLGAGFSGFEVRGALGEGCVKRVLGCAEGRQGA